MPSVKKNKYYVVLSVFQRQTKAMSLLLFKSSALRSIAWHNQFSKFPLYLGLAHLTPSPASSEQRSHAGSRWLQPQQGALHGQS